MPALESYKRESDLTYACGFFPALECVRKRPELVRRVLLSERASGEGLRLLTELSALHGIRIEYADKALRRISGKDNCFAAAVTQKPTAALLPGRHIVLHHISDEGNLGTILRTALGFGFTDIAVITPAADAFAPHVVRACMGAVYSLRVREYPDFEKYREDFPAQAMYPFMLKGSLEVTKAARNAPSDISLVFGNEGSGLPDSFLSVGQPTRIEHSGDIDSLNLAVAAAIGMFAFGRHDKEDDSIGS